MSAEPYWGRDGRPYRPSGPILPMYAPPARRWWPLWSALAAFLFFAALVALGELSLTGRSPVAGGAGGGTMHPAASATRGAIVAGADPQLRR